MNWMANKNRPAMKLVEQRQNEFFERFRVGRTLHQSTSTKANNADPEAKARLMRLVLFHGDNAQDTSSSADTSRKRSLVVDAPISANNTGAKNGTVNEEPKSHCLKSLNELDQLSWANYPRPNKKSKQHEFDLLYDNQAGAKSNKEDSIKQTCKGPDTQEKGKNKKKRTPKKSKGANEQQQLKRSAILRKLLQSTVTTSSIHSIDTGEVPNQRCRANVNLDEDEEDAVQKQDKSKSNKTLMIGCEDPLVLTPAHAQHAADEANTTQTLD